MIDLTESPLPAVPERRSDSHKGHYGRAVIVGGSLGMAGAPALAGMACLRSGAGLVTIVTPPRIQATVASYCAAYTTTTVPHRSFALTLSESYLVGGLVKLRSAIGETSAVAIGPGLGTHNATSQTVVAAYHGLPVPVVLDADALNALAKHTDRLQPPPASRVLTPHAGEFARLDGEPLTDPNDDAERLERASALPLRLGGPQTVVLLKGPRTVVTDGQRYTINTTGNPGMATGGSGDVLTGVITALLAQGLDAFDAARLGAHVHGLAGDLAAAKLGQIGMIATDLVDQLPEAWELVGKRSN